MKFRKTEPENKESRQRFDSVKEVDENWIITEDQDGKWAAFKLDENDQIEEEIGTNLGGPNYLTSLERLLDFEIDIATPRWVNLDQKQKEYFRGLVKEYLQETGDKTYTNITRGIVYDNLKDASAYLNTDEPTIAFYN